MGLGQLILITLNDSISNLYLTNEPQITFFKSVFKKYTNFAIETIPIFFNNTVNFGKKVTANISKNADLLGKISLYIELPSLPLSNHTILPAGKKKIKWVDKIGLSIIDYIDFELGGIIIDRIYTDWLNIWYELTNSENVKNGYNKIIGNTSDLYNYSNGKKKEILHIPINFWFCQDIGLALPLLNLKNHDIKIHVQFNQFNKCIKESPTNYFETDNLVCLFEENEIITQEINGITYKGEFIYFDLIKQRVYYNKLLGDFQIPTTTNTLYKITGKTSNYEISPKVNTSIVKDENYFYYGNPVIEKSYIIANYIYLGKEESKKIRSEDQEYLIPKINFTLEKKLYSTNNNYKIPLNNPTKTIFWRCILQSNIDNNDKFNYTTYPLTESENNIINKNKIIINSTEIINVDNWQYYNYLQNYQSKFNSPQKGIYSYSFALSPKNYQPSGSLNFSKIDDSFLELTLNTNINYQNPINIKLYNLVYNILKISDGLGGLKYYL